MNTTVSNKKHARSLFFLISLAILVAVNSFGKLYPDSNAYLALINGELIPPFCYRPMIPSIASLFTTPPIFTIALLNTGFLLALTIVLYMICVQVGATPNTAVIATTAATISNPVIFYSTAVLVDVSYIFFVALAILLMLHPRTKDKWYLILAIICLGVFFKESAAIGSVIYLLYTKKREHIPAFVLGPTFAYLGCRLSVGVLLMDGAKDFWFPSLDFLFMLPQIFLILFLNLMTFIFIFIWIILLLPSVHISVPQLDWVMPIIAGTGALMLYAMTSASFDGRFVWPLFLAFTPLTAVALAGFGKQKEIEE